MEAKLGTLVMIALLLAGGAQAWSQPGGGPSRDEAVILPGGPLDVLARADLGGMTLAGYWGAGLLPTREGYTASLRGEDGGCVLAFMPDLMADSYVRHSASDCNYPVLVAYDEATNAAILCHNSPRTRPVLEARDATTGVQRWGVSAQMIGNAPGEFSAYCLSAALDEKGREIVAPVMGCCDTRSARIVAVDVDTGEVRWARPIPTGPSLGPATLVELPVAPQSQIYESYHGITLTTTGIVVSGYYACPGCEEGVLAWADRQGEVIGKERAVTSEPTEIGPSAYERTRGASQYAVANGPLAAAVLGDEIVLINPELPAPIARRPIEAASPNTFSTFIHKSHWQRDQIIAALGTSFTAFEASTLERSWSWSEGLDVSIVDSVRTQSGDILALLEHRSDARLRLATIDTQSGTTRHSVVLPIEVPEEQRFSFDAHIIPLTGEGLLVLDEVGRRVHLGPAPHEELPRLTLDPEYPAPGESVRVLIDAPPGLEIVSYDVTWEGDGSETLGTTDLAQHVFAQRGDKEVRVVATLADGRTRTALATVHVGGTPPPQLTPLQRAFSPENQEVTFFVLGATLTILGAAFTIGRQRRRHSKLERELAAVEEIRMLSTSDPRAATLSLKAFRHKLPEELAKRRIDDAQYHVLDVRTARLLRVLRTRMFAPWDALLSAPFHRLMDATFEDAIITPAEERALLDALASESLTDEERAGIAGVLRDFTT